MGAIRDRQVGETRRDGGVKQDEAAGWRIRLGEICRSLSPDFNGGVAYEICACVCNRESFLCPSATFSSSHLRLLLLWSNLKTFSFEFAFN